VRWSPLRSWALPPFVEVVAALRDYNNMGRPISQHPISIIFPPPFLPDFYPDSIIFLSLFLGWGIAPQMRLYCMIIPWHCRFQWCFFWFLSTADNEGSLDKFGVMPNTEHYKDLITFKGWFYGCFG